MSDIVDITQERAEKEEEARSKVRTYMAGVRELEPCGNCHYCGEYVQNNRLFCSRDCSEDHALMLKRMRESGL